VVSVCADAATNAVSAKTRINNDVEL